MFTKATAWNATYFRDPDDGTFDGPPSAWIAFPPPPAPLSETERKQAELEEKKREAEEKRAEARALREDAAEKKAAADAQYGDFVGDVEGLDGVDEDVKRKILMLADALMKNQKVVEMAAPAVSAANEEEAVSIVQDTSGIPDSAAVWTATAAGVRRRGLLQSDSYDVTALLDPDEVDESAAAAAVDALNTGGISATERTSTRRRRSRTPRATRAWIPWSSPSSRSRRRRTRRRRRRRPPRRLRRRRRKRRRTRRRARSCFLRRRRPAAAAESAAESAHLGRRGRRERTRARAG